WRGCATRRTSSRCERQAGARSREPAAPGIRSLSARAGEAASPPSCLRTVADLTRSVAVGLVADSLAGVRIVAEALDADDQCVARRQRTAKGHRAGEALRAEREPRLTSVRIGLGPEPHGNAWPATVQLGPHAHAGAERRTRDQQTPREGAHPTRDDVRHP